MDLNRDAGRRAVTCAGMLGALLSLGSGPLLAQEAANPNAETTVTNGPALKVNVRRNVEGTYIPYRFAFITAGAEKFTFLIPENYRVDTTDPTKVKMASADYSVMLIVGVNGGQSVGTKLESSALRARVQANYPEAVINAEETIGANGQIAPAIDFTWKADTGITRKSRTTFVPSTVGLIEFTLTASPEKFDASLAELNLVLLTFRSGKDGKFDYVIGSKLP